MTDSKSSTAFQWSGNSSEIRGLMLDKMTPGNKIQHRMKNGKKSHAMCVFVYYKNMSNYEAFCKIHHQASASDF